MSAILFRLLWIRSQPVRYQYKLSDPAPQNKQLPKFSLSDLFLFIMLYVSRNPFYYRKLSCITSWISNYNYALWEYVNTRPYN